jgi:type I site-specific restriction endonuclease
MIYHLSSTLTASPDREMCSAFLVFFFSGLSCWPMRWYTRYPPHTYRLFSSRSQSHSTVSLRPYQKLCLEACGNALKRGLSRIGVSLPTGSGKTTVFIALLERIKPPKENPNATRALIIVNSVELARQSAEQIPRQFPSWSVEIEQGAKYKATGGADVFVNLSVFALQPTESIAGLLQRTRPYSSQKG